MDYLQNGIEIKYFAKGEERAALVYLLDYQRQENNTFQVVNQFTYIENGNNRRPDILLFINGCLLYTSPAPPKPSQWAENSPLQSVCLPPRPPAGRCSTFRTSRQSTSIFFISTHYNKSFL